MDRQPRRFGLYDVTTLRDGFFEAPADVLIHTGGEPARQRAIGHWGRPGIGVVVNCFLLRGPGGLTLVDAGTGTAWGPAFGHARAEMAALGVTPEQVDRVLLTHLHGDHALGLFAGEAAWLPRAEIVVPQRDLDFFTDATARAAAPEGRRGGFDIAAALRRSYAGRIRPVAEGLLPAELGLDGIEMLALPGHTPGHSGYRIGDDERSLLLWGDLLHLETLQPGEPEIGLVYDLDPAVAARTRRDTLGRAAREGWVIAGGHVDGFGQVVAAGDGFRVLPA